MKFGIPKISLGRDITLLLGAVVILHIASYIVIPVLPVILKSDKGLDAAQVGIVVAAGSLAFQGGSVTGGLLSDRMGKKPTMVLGAAIQGVGILGYGLVDLFFTLTIFSIINGVGSGIYAPTVKAAIASIAAQSAKTKTTAFSLRGIAANVGVSIAGLVVLVLAGVSSNILFYIGGGVFILLSILSWVLLPKECGDKGCPIIPPDAYKQIIRNKSFMTFSLVTVLVWAVYAQFSLLLPLRGEAVLANGKLVGTIWTITSIVVIVFQGIISKYILQKINPFIATFIGVIFIGAGIFAIGLAYNFTFLTISALIFLVGEMLMLPTLDSLTSQFANPELIGAYFSIANLISGVGTAIGNFTAGRLINAYGVTAITPWIIFAIVSGVVAVVVLFIRNLPVQSTEMSKQGT